MAKVRRAAGPRNAHKGKPIMIYLPVGQVAALDRDARERGAPWTRSAIVRDLIAKHIQQLKLPGIS